MADNDKADVLRSLHISEEDVIEILKLWEHAEVQACLADATSELDGRRSGSDTPEFLACAIGYAAAAAAYRSAVDKIKLDLFVEEKMNPTGTGVD